MRIAGTLLGGWLRDGLIIGIEDTRGWDRAGAREVRARKYTTGL